MSDTERAERVEHRREYCQKHCPIGVDGHCISHAPTQERLKHSENTVLIIRTFFKPALGVLFAIFLALFGTLAGMYWMVADIKASAAVMAAVVNNQETTITSVRNKLSHHLEGGAMDWHKKMHDQMGSKEGGDKH